MALTGQEQAYLAAQPRGRLATVTPDGSPQNKPVGFRYNPGLGTIEKAGEVNALPKSHTWYVLVRTYNSQC